MKRLCLAAVLLLAGCSGTDTDDTEQMTDAGNMGDSPETERGVRICELNELFIADDALWIRVWNDVGLHDCPDDWLSAIDMDAYAVGGPRWRSVDTVVPIGGTPDLGTPEEVPAGLGYMMVEAATVELFPLSTLEQQLGTTIETLDDIPVPARRSVLDTTLFGTSYVPSEVQREFTTEFVHFAGQRVFVIDDGQCQYAMKYYTSILDPELVDEDAVATLGDRLTQLPEGYSFSVEVFDEDLVIREAEGVQYVIVDEFGNSYDRFACN
ncbi:MAG: hypothetical protein AAFU79_20025 [Myxococcota bacterium]